MSICSARNQILHVEPPPADHLRMRAFNIVKSPVATAAVACLALLIPTCRAKASPIVVATDTASLYLKGGFENGATHGHGWGPFAIKSTSTDLAFPCTARTGSQVLGAPAGESLFTIYAFGKDSAGNPATTIAIRPYTRDTFGDVPGEMQPGETFSTSFGAKPAAPGGTVGFGLADATGRMLFKFFYDPAQPNFQVYDSAGPAPTTIPYSATLFSNLTFTLTSLYAYEFHVPVPAGPDVPGQTFTYKGQINGGIAEVVYFDIAGGNSSAVFFDRLLLTKPAPIKRGKTPSSGITH